MSVLRETVEPVRSAGQDAVERAPLAELDLRLGQGSGVMQAVPLVRTAARVLNKVSAVDAVIDKEAAS